MARRNKPTDVWRHIDMCNGDIEQCWLWKLKPGAISKAMRDGEKSSMSKARPYFTINGRKYIATRIVYEQFNGVELTNDQVIRHKCDNSICCNPHHLEVGTHADNVDDMVSRDRHGLPHHVVRRIRLLLIKGDKTHKEIGELYGVSRSIVTRISNNQMHTHADDYPQDVVDS